MPLFHVTFFNPQTHHLHSTAKVDSDNPATAVQDAVAHIQSTMRGTEVADLPTFRAAVTDENHNPIAGFEKAMSKAQLVAELQKLQASIDALGEDPLPAPSAPVSTEVSPSQAPSGTAARKFTQADIDAAVAAAKAQSAVARVGANA